MTDRPWGLTLGAVASRRHTGQLTIDADGKRYAIAFSGGAIIAAVSPVPADALARIALTSQFITAGQVGELNRRFAAQPERDEVEVLAEAIGLSAEQVMKLRQRAIAQRAARTFALERGQFAIDDRVALPVVPGVAIDPRHVIYLGAHSQLTDQRLVDDLREIGSYFTLRPEAMAELASFGFEREAQAVLDALAAGTTVPELEAAHRELDPRLVQAVIYALVSCNACIASPRGPEPRTPESLPRAPLTRTQPMPSAPLKPPAAPAPAPTRPPLPTRADPRTVTSPFASGSRTSSTYVTRAVDDSGTNTPAATRRSTPVSVAPAVPPAAAPKLAAPTRVPSSTSPPPGTGTPELIPPAAGTGPTMMPPVSATPATPPAPPRTLTEDGEDGIRFADVPTPSPLSPSAKTTATFSVSRVLTPNEAELRAGFGDQRTPTPGFSPGFGDQRTPAPSFGDQRTPGPAFGEQRTPSDPALGRTPTSPATSRVTTSNAAAAEAAFKRGEQAMKRDQPHEAILEFKTALDHNPADIDTAAMLAWARFAAAGDKAAVGGEARKILERAVFKSQRPERARFYLGRVERMLGRDKEALRHFHEVLELKPNHAEAASEVRAIEARLAASKGGLFGKKR